MYKRRTKICTRFLNDIVEKNISCVKIILTPNNNTPLFNGGTEEDISSLDKYLQNHSLKIKDKKVVGGINVLKNKSINIYVDVSNPPNKSYSSFYQSAPCRSNIIWIIKRSLLTVVLVLIFLLKQNY